MDTLLGSSESDRSVDTVTVQIRKSRNVKTRTDQTFDGKLPIHCKSSKTTQKWLNLIGFYML